MQTRMFKAVVAGVLTLAITAFAIPSLSAKEKPAAATQAKDGRLIIKRAPSLGNRLIIALEIDGKASSIGYGHTYRTNLAPGHHKLSVIATPRPQNTKPWEMSLDVQPGQTYTFLAQSGPNRQLVLAKTR